MKKKKKCKLSKEIRQYIQKDILALYGFCARNYVDTDSVKERSGWHVAHGMYENRFWCSCGYIKVMSSDMYEWKYCPICGTTEQNANTNISEMYSAILTK